MSSSSEQDHRSTRNDQLIPPGSAAAPVESGKRALFFMAAAFLVLLSGLLGVIFFLPGDDDSEPSSETAVIHQPEHPDQEKETRLAVDPERPAAIAARESFLTLKIDAESLNVSRWGGGDYRVLNERFAEGDGLFQRQEYGAASRTYVEAYDMLETLINSREQLVQEALQAGQDSLRDMQYSEAASRFKQALAIEPENEAAQEGLERAETGSAVQKLYQQALGLEQSDRLEEAAAQLRQALELDEGYDPALKLLNNIEARINEATFSEVMNIMLSALDQQDFAAADKALQKLRSLGIRSAQVEQAETLVADKQKQVLVEALRAQATELEESEQWQQALERYEKILEAAPDALFALAGKENSAQRAELQRALEQAIGRPERLQEKEQRVAARRLLDYAGQIEPRGPELEARIHTLTDFLRAAETPVAVTLESDNQTDVVIYHVGRIGSFSNHRLWLEPGIYTVVGSRPGYRDVIKKMAIEAGGTGARFDIRCEEPI